MITRSSPDWIGTKAWLEAEIETSRCELEGANCDLRQADQLRGRIAAYRHIITTADPPAKADDQPPPEGQRPRTMY